MFYARDDSQKAGVITWEVAAALPPPTWQLPLTPEESRPAWIPHIPSVDFLYFNIYALALPHPVRRLDVGILELVDLTRFQSVISEASPTHLSFTIQARNWTNLAVSSILRTASRLTHLVLTVDISEDVANSDSLDNPRVSPKHL